MDGMTVVQEQMNNGTNPSRTVADDDDLLRKNIVEILVEALRIFRPRKHPPALKRKNNTKRNRRTSSLPIFLCRI